jgi:hypothetical protein
MGRRHGVWIVGVLALAACVSFSGAAKTKEPPWKARDWTNWTMQDCEAVMQQSPWAYYYSSSAGRFDRTLLEFDSALPVRQAKLRSQQLNNHYDKMNPAQKQAFDQQHAGDLPVTDDGPILLFVYQYMDYGYFPPRGPELVFGPPSGGWAALRLPNGKLILPIETTRQKVENTQLENAYLYTFPRHLDGKPTLTGNDQEITVIFGDILPKADAQGRIAPLEIEDFHANSDPRSGVPGHTFIIPDMMYKGKLEY